MDTTWRCENESHSGVHQWSGGLGPGVCTRTPTAWGGGGLFQHLFVRVSLDQLASLTWAGKEMGIATHVVWHEDKWISPALGAFVSLLVPDFTANTGTKTAVIANFDPEEAAVA